MRSIVAVVSVVGPLFLAAPASAALPEVAGCQVFPFDNVWNQPVDELPVHALSSQWVNEIGPNVNFHADFSSLAFNDGFGYGIPWIDVAGSQTPVAIVFGPEADDESDPGPYPIPPTAPVEHASDRHVLVVDRDACILYELYDAVKQLDDSWTAYSGAIFDLDSNVLRPDSWTSADAAGLPILPGLVRFSEADSGEIHHALRFTAEQTLDGPWLWPARHEAGEPACPLCPPMGARFRLKSTVSLAGLSPHALTIARAMQKYGIILADNGSSWYVQGEPHASWDDDVLHELDFIEGSDFEAVDTSSWIVDPDSGMASYPYVFDDGFESGNTSGWSSTVP